MDDRATQRSGYPLTIPDALLQSEVMRQACAARDFQEIFRLVNRRTGSSYAVMAAAVGKMTTSRVSDIIRGVRGIRGREVIERVADGFGIPGDMLGLARRPWEIPRGSGHGHIVASGIAEALSPPGSGISPFDGMTLQQSGEHLLRMFLHLDDELGGDSLFLPLSRYVARMAISVRKNPDDGLLAFGQLNQMAGWLALDANSHATATKYFVEAVRVGREADEPGLAASALAYMSLQETYRGQRASALSLAQEAAALNSRKLTPLTRTILATRLARAYAAMGDERSCWKALEAARNDFDKAGSVEEPHYVPYVDSIEVAAQEGACFLELGMSKEAVMSLTSAIGLLGIHAPNRVRDQVHYLSRLAKCYLLDGEVEQACRTGRHALGFSRTIGSARVSERLGEFDELLTPYSGVSSVAAFKEEYRTSMRGMPG
ncbi:XRE family transcriptional regulator [Streptomyces sp. NPDC020719]|uniref:XRE family transcriptional regulator n=1 Tax=Streptomyces sp. NPDC020719 TaxID=3154896 RepID=UPI0033C9E017